MKTILLLVASCLILVGTAFPQSAAVAAEGPKTISAPSPAFPEEAARLIYGDWVSVLMDVNKKGQVTSARPLGPLTPCSNLKDRVPPEIRKAAVAAAKETTFEPILKDGRPVEVQLEYRYRLRPIVRPLPDEERRTIIGGYITGKAISLPAPAYPPQAMSVRVTGAISVRVLVGEDGSVLSAGMISGHPYFEQSGVQAACSARFVPATLRNEPARVTGVLTYVFQR